MGSVKHSQTHKYNMPKHLALKRVFSTAGIDPFDQVKWEKRTAEITDDKGKVIFSQKDVEVPEFWSQLATKVVVSKYFYGEQNTPERETSVKQLINRIARTMADWAIKDGYFSKEDGEIFYDELKFLSLNQYGAFNSPVWFNVGLHAQYGVGKNSTRGNWRYDPTLNQPVRPKTQYDYPQCSACFIQSVKDDMESIMSLATSEAMLFKFGSGTGTDLTPLRSKREKLSGGGRPSGPLSFLTVYDQVAGIVKSGGKTRRAAKMNTLRDWHGDIEEFIQCKTQEEKKAHALIAQGYDSSFNGEAYASVKYQNENLSVRVSDEFMQAAVDNKPWWTRAVVTGKPLEEKNAGKLLHEIAAGTWFCGDPGLQYDGTIQKWHTCKGTEPIHSTNPCSEYVFLNNTACNLASLNLMKFKNADGTFDTDRYRAAVRIYLTAQEILVDNSSYPIAQIAENSHIFRTLGLGYCNLGSLIMSYGLAYDSDEARALTGALTAIMTGEAYTQSARMAESMGAFKGYHDARCSGVEKTVAKDNVASMLEVIKMHRDEVKNIHPDARFKYLAECAQETWDSALDLGQQFGYRNAQVTVLAPTGTISFFMDSDTTGIEPDIALVKYKILAGGGNLKIVNNTVPEAMRSLGYDAAAIKKVVAHIEAYDTIEDVTLTADDAIVKDGTKQVGEIITSGLKPEHIPVFDCAFKAARGTRSLHYKAHLLIMSAAQPFLSGAISKTVNVPNNATVEDIKQAYVEAWKMGLKCVAIYRDGSKMSQPLNTAKKVEEEAENLKSTVADLQAEVESLKLQVGMPVRRRMPDTRTSITHKFDIAGHEGYFTVGLYEDGTPGEMFITMSKEGSTIGGLMDTIATLTSVSLQYGVPLEDLVRKFSYQRFEPNGFTKNPEIRQATSIVDYIYRWMGKNFIKPDEATPSIPVVEVKPVASVNHVDKAVAATKHVTDKKSPAVNALNRSMAHFQSDAPLCSECGSTMVRNGACYKCMNCGSSSGCSG